MKADNRGRVTKKMKALTEKLEAGINDLFESQKYLDYLRKMSCFHGYSPNNILLIQMQKPDASLVAGYKTWQTLERQVKKGETGITILIPCPYKKTTELEVVDPMTKEPKRDEEGKVMTEWKSVSYLTFRSATIFDISQTEGKELPTLAEDLKGTVQNYSVFFDAICEVAPVPIRFDVIEDKKKGYYSLISREIIIKDDMSELQTIKTAIHETAHSILHSARLKDAATMEVEAESIAYVVCQNFGLDTSDYSFGYIAGWSRSRELPELHDSLTTIQRTSHMLIKQLETQMHKRMHQHEHAEAISELPSITENLRHRR